MTAWTALFIGIGVGFVAGGFVMYWLMKPLITSMVEALMDAENLINYLQAQSKSRINNGRN